MDAQVPFYNLGVMKLESLRAIIVRKVNLTVRFLVVLGVQEKQQPQILQVLLLST